MTKDSLEYNNEEEGQIKKIQGPRITTEFKTWPMTDWLWKDKDCFDKYKE